MVRAQAELEDYAGPSVFAQNVLDFLFDLVVKSDRATRQLGEEDVKGNHILQTLHSDVQ